MKEYDRINLGRKAKELGFVRDTFEKVNRLIDVLIFIGQDKQLKNTLALKGGTAINLAILNLPRLSVDIDLDYSQDCLKEEMLINRKIIDKAIREYMEVQGYTLSLKSRYHHALDSYIFEYINSGGTKDNLKIDINYMNRCHVLPLCNRKVSIPWYEEEFTVLCVDPLEIYASKANALLNRAAPRDLYDLYNIGKYGLINDKDSELFKKCIVFYRAISTNDPLIDFSLNSIDAITYKRIKSELNPVLRNSERFNCEEAKDYIKKYLSEVLKLHKNELEFIKEFSKGNYKPELLFDDSEIIARIDKHPMAIFKTN